MKLDEKIPVPCVPWYVLKSFQQFQQVFKFVAHSIFAVYVGNIYGIPVDIFLLQTNWIHL